MSQEPNTNEIQTKQQKLNSRAKSVSNVGKKSASNNQHDGKELLCNTQEKLSSQKEEQNSSTKTKSKRHSVSVQENRVPPAAPSKNPDIKNKEKIFNIGESNKSSFNIYKQEEGCNKTQTRRPLTSNKQHKDIENTSSNINRNHSNVKNNPMSHESSVVKQNKLHEIFKAHEGNIDKTTNTRESNSKVNLNQSKTEVLSQKVEENKDSIQENNAKKVQSQHKNYKELEHQNNFGDNEKINNSANLKESKRSSTPMKTSSKIKHINHEVKSKSKELEARIPKKFEDKQYNSTGSTTHKSNNYIKPKRLERDNENKVKNCIPECEIEPEPNSEPAPKPSPAPTPISVKVPPPAQIPIPTPPPAQASNPPSAEAPVATTAKKKPIAKPALSRQPKNETKKKVSIEIPQAQPQEPEEQKSEKSSVKPILKAKKSIEKPAKKIIEKPAKKAVVKPPKKTTQKLNKKPAKSTIKSSDPQDGRVQCSCCQRWFNSDRIDKHEDACYKMQNANRKVFNSTKQRQVDSDQTYLKKMNKGKYDKVDKSSEGKNAKWKEKSNAFREAMKAAREGTTAPPTVDSSLVPCQFCGRKFNEKAAERHIPFCESKTKDNMMKQSQKGYKK